MCNDRTGRHVHVQSCTMAVGYMQGDWVSVTNETGQTG